MFVKERFKIKHISTSILRKQPVKFGWPESGFGEYIYYRHYSRTIRDELGFEIGQEDWYDTCIRVIEGVMSIRKDWYLRNYIVWNESAMQRYAYEMCRALIRMEWLPPGRGLWAMGSEVVYERGAMPLYNCAFTDVAYDWVDDICWLMDVLMNGVGVGFQPVRTGLKGQLWEPSRTERYVIPDTREGWVQSVRILLEAFCSQGGALPEFDYSLIRLEGEPIISFGGIAAGPDPLKRFHKQAEGLCYRFIRDDDYDEIQFKTDLCNLAGVCVISGNVRRSAEIAIGDPTDPVFSELKNYEKYPEREAWGWMSNNSLALLDDRDFENLDLIAQANASGHDVGILNLRNFPHGRIGKHDEVPIDQAVGLNPCGEIPLEHREVCNLAETLPTRCSNQDSWLKACEYATFYASTVALLPTHHASTNAVVMRNRRIGVSIIDYTGWKQEVGVRGTIRHMRAGYTRIREVNKRLADEAGVPESIRVTTVKPGGTVPKLAGRTSGIGHPTHTYTYRRVNVGKGTPIERILIEAGVPYEESAYTPETTNVFGFPIKQGPAEPATEVSIWEQAANLVTVQREWADNAVSNTLYFKPMWVLESTWNRNDDPARLQLLIQRVIADRSGRYREANVQEGRLKIWIDTETDQVKLYRLDPNHEEGDLEAVLAHIAPYVKSVSLLPHTAEGIFKQMPEEGITKEKYDELLRTISKIDWTSFEHSDGIDEKFCTGDHCEVPAN